ncbi:MAG TPA: hypothetical protein VF533_06535 [Solirubrobacteraceae bacterium]|jgi:hypothetical protein
MSGLLRRLRPSADAKDPPADAPVAEPAPAEDPSATAAVEAPQPSSSEPVTEEGMPAAAPPEDATQVMPAAAPPEDATRVMPAGAPVLQSGGLPGDAPAVVVDADDLVEERPLPAGVAPEDLIGERPDTRRRSRLRRRARHLRHVRELMLRDIGGLVYEIRRSGQDAGADPHATELVTGKLERLAALDAERHDLEATLGLARSATILREPGVGGACPVCSEYFASDAHFCFRCGARVDGRHEPAAPVVAEPAALWAGAPAPAEPATVPDEPAAAAPEPTEPAAPPEAPAADAPADANGHHPTRTETAP